MLAPKKVKHRKVHRGRRRGRATGGTEVHFGDYGLVGVVLGVAEGNALAIDTWLMSCRVIGRTLEQLVLRELVGRGEHLGYRRIVGEYVATAKNALVAGLYGELGFTPLGSLGSGRHVLELPAGGLPRTFVAVE